MNTTAVAAGSYEALHADAVLVDRSTRVRMTFSGEKAKEALGGLLTSDVATLSAGQSQLGVALTPKGRVISVVRVVDRGTDLLVDADAASGDAFVAMIKKFVNPRLAKYEVVTDRTAALGVYGPRAETLRESVGAELTVVPSAEFGVAGFDAIGSPEAVAALRATLEAAGLGAASEETLEIARVEAGTPRFGKDFDGETIPQEANLDTLGAISFNKGCYTGQEVVARIHFRGHVNRHLRWLVSEAALPVGAAVLDATGKDVGDVRSSVVSPRRGPLAIAMVRREVEPGSVVQVHAGEQLASARVEAIA